MDLIRYRILGDFLNIMHQEKEIQAVQEINQGQGIILDFHNFEGRYGKKHSVIGYDLKNLYTEYESGVQEILAGKRRASSPALQYKFEEWFLNQLAGQELEEDKEDVPAEMVLALNRFIKSLFHRHQETVNAFKMMVYEHVSKTFFSKKKNQMEGIITNMLDLLAWLNQRDVAMRDLKPDNLIVTGDPETNPNFMSSPDHYDLGLIDVETAVITRTQGQTQMDQPQLGGTPVYSTPSQLFSNKVLGNAFEKVPDILCLQDWYAAVGTIYEIVTGEYLFEQTAGKLQTIMRAIQKFDAKKQKVSEFMEEASTAFWKSAVSEFRTKIKRNEKPLNYLTVSLPDNVREMLLDRLRDERKQLSQAIKSQVDSRSHLGPEKLKEDLKSLDVSIRALNRPDRNITAYGLVEIMFNVVVRNMT